MQPPNEDGHIELIALISRLRLMSQLPDSVYTFVLRRTLQNAGIGNVLDEIISLRNLNFVLE